MNMVMNHKNIYVLIAIHDRPNLLSCIALPSIARQTYQPTGIVLIDDSTDNYVSGKVHTVDYPK
jgi:hypothetical protein